MSKETMEGRFNARKKETISLIKEKGKYLKYCSERGFLYQVVGPIFGMNHRFTVALKSGHFQLISMEQY